MCVWDWVFWGGIDEDLGRSGGVVLSVMVTEIIASVRFWVMFGPGNFECKMCSGGSGLRSLL